MRNPFRRQHRPTNKPTLRERMAATREKFGRTLRVHRALNAPMPKPAPPVDRAALVNYATFLAWERNRVCAELYPHLGTRGTRFVLGLNAADRFFHPSSDYRVRVDVPPASTRAVKVLDAVGIDWRSDPPGDGIERSIGGTEYADTGERPAVPYGWPAIDAALVEASANLVQLDAGIAALIKGDGRDAEAVPGYQGLEDARTAALVTLTDQRAEGVRGLQAKARAILTPELGADIFTASDLGQSLARDLLAIDGRAIEPQPDPIFAAIKECERLEAACTAEYAKGNDGNATPAQSVAASAVWNHINGPLSETVPTTAAGCVALARFIPPLFERWAASLDGDQAGKLFRLIDRSPAL